MELNKIKKGDLLHKEEPTFFFLLMLLIRQFFRRGVAALILSIFEILFLPIVQVFDKLLGIALKIFIHAINLLIDWTLVNVTNQQEKHAATKVWKKISHKKSLRIPGSF
jgi:predicted membrane protein